MNLKSVIILLIIAIALLFGASFLQGNSSNSGHGNTSEEVMQMEEGLVIESENKPEESLEINDEESMTQESRPVAVFTTNKGTFEIELYTDQVPKTAGNFEKLAKEGFYDGTKFHRIIDGFMIQGGDPQSKDDALSGVWGTGGPGYQFDDEFADGLSNVVGTISMANSGPNTNGSQFFINVNDNTFLDFDKEPLQSKHSVFGAITSGMDVINELSKVETLPGDKPAEPVVIESVVIK